MKNIEINTHSSIKILGDKIIYFDPFKIEGCTHDADYIFITHDHYDHYDVSSIKNIMKESTKIIVPEKMKDQVEELGLETITVKPNNNYEVDSMSITTVPSYNIRKEFHPKENNWVGYIIEIDNEKYYIPGDTDVLKENESIFVDVAFIPIGGKFTMDYQEAAKFINKIKPHTVIPIHYGSLIGNVSLGSEFAKLLDHDIECIIIIK